MPGFAIPLAVPGYPAPNLEAGRQHRFRFAIDEPLPDGIEPFSLYCLSVKRPRQEIKSTTVFNGPSQANFASRVVFGDLGVRLYETYHNNNPDKSIHRILLGWRKLIIDELAYTGVVTYKRNAHLDLTWGNGAVALRYLYYGIWPTMVTPNDLSYSNSAVSEIDVTFKIDWMRELSKTDLKEIGVETDPMVAIYTNGLEIIKT